MAAVDRGQAFKAGDVAPCALLEGDFVGGDDGHAQAAARPSGALEPTVISVNEAIRRLRSILKGRYPDVRFKVRVTRGLERSLDIEWAGGPLADEVVTISRDYINGGQQRDDLVNNGGTDGDLPRQGMRPEGSRYDVCRIDVCRLKADGSIDATRLLRTNENE